MELTERSEAIFWIDTISNGKFLKIYSKRENNRQNLTAEFGNAKEKYKVDLQTEEYGILTVPFTNQIKWITDKSFVLLNGCGTSCKYVTIFNVKFEKPIIMPVEYYSGITYAVYKTDNHNLYLAANSNYTNKPSFIIVDTDTQKKDTIELPESWNRGNGSIMSVIDKIKIKHSTIEVFQMLKNGKQRLVKQNIKLE
ncbi:hypothetical protein [Zunongwangia sp. H14]|uniref:hypothetical protein n=1 Tax=Zunongwangia sp. H14 TaxID=3240792 RepID=UPI003562E2D7